MAGKDRDDDETGISGKRKKTWRELDAQRGKSKYHSRQDDPQQQRIERSPSYEKYKKAADSLFGGGELPQGLAETFDPDGKRKERRVASWRFDAEQVPRVPALARFSRLRPRCAALEHPGEPRGGGAEACFAGLRRR